MKSFQEQEAKRQALIAKGIPDLTPDQAAVRIQSGWRGHKARQLTKQMRWEEEAFINMRLDSNQPSQLVDRAAKIEQNRREWLVLVLFIRCLQVLKSFDHVVVVSL